MTLLLNTFEGQPDGTSVIASTSGGASGNAFDTGSIGSGGVQIYSTDQAAFGTRSCKEQTTTANPNNLQWTTSMGAKSQIWFRTYLYWASLPAVTTRFFAVLAGGTGLARFAINTSGKFLLQNAAGTTIATAAVAIPTAQWFRVEGMAIISATVGQLETKLFSTFDSVTPDETTTTAATQNTNGTVTGYAFGPGAGTSGQGPFYMDMVAISDQGYIGPAVPTYRWGQDNDDGGGGF